MLTGEPRARTLDEGLILQQTTPSTPCHWAAHLHAIVELTNDGDNTLWHAKMGEYYPEEGSINEAVRFGKVDKSYIQRNSFLPYRLL